MVSGFGINCGYFCNNTSANFKDKTSLVLIPYPQPGSVFSGWNGSCSGTGLCRMTMDSSKGVIANFSSVNYTLAIKTIKNGGSGKITSRPVGLAGANSCDSTCDKDYPIDSIVILNASADDNSVFSGWDGACGGKKICMVMMSRPQNISATFSKSVAITYKLSVSKTGSGGGTVQSSNISGIDCGSNCVSSFDSDFSVTLTATNDSGSEFVGWEGDTCRGKNTECKVKIDKAKEIKANFNKI